MYKEYEAEIWKKWKAKANLVIVTVAGMSENFFAKKFWEKWRKEGVGYVDGPGQKTEEFTVLNLNWAGNENALELANEYLQKAKGERFAVVVNRPMMTKTKEFKTSYVGQHVYGIYYLRALPEDMMEIFSQELDLKATDAELTKIYQLTGGVGKWVKWLLVHREKLNTKAEELMADEGFELILEPTAGLAGECGDEQLEKLGLWERGQWKGKILATYFAKHQRRKKLEVEITADLGVVEKGKINGSRLTKLEADILRRMVESEGVITKENISDLKWGEVGYDKFSDQAINKGMRRLDKKLEVYAVKTIPGYGFKLVERER